jgi:hypothetical protein
MENTINSYQKIIKIDNRIKVIEAFKYDFNHSKTIEQINESVNLGTSGVKMHLRQLWSDMILNRDLGKYEYVNGVKKKINRYYLNSDLTKDELFKYTIKSFKHTIYKNN